MIGTGIVMMTDTILRMKKSARLTWTKTSCCAIVVVLLGIPAFLVRERIT